MANTIPAILNDNAIQAAGGQVYLALSPKTVVGTTTEAIIKELFEIFLVDGDARSALKPTVFPWAIPDNNGFKAKIEQKAIKVNPNPGSERTIGYEDTGYSAELTIYDVDVDHLRDLISALPEQVLSLDASDTQAGRKTLMGGGQRNPIHYALLYRFASAEVPGEFRHVLIPRCTLSADGDQEKSKSKAIQSKVTIGAENFNLLPDPVTGFGVVWLEDYVTDPKTA